MSIKEEICTTVLCNGCQTVMGDAGEGIPHFPKTDEGIDARKEDISNWEWAMVPRQPWVEERHYCPECNPPDCACGHQHTRGWREIDDHCEGGMEEEDCECVKYIPVKPEV
jgi:hypothetical protein